MFHPTVQCGDRCRAVANDGTIASYFAAGESPAGHSSVSECSGCDGVSLPIGEECGVFGVFGVDDAASVIYRGLFAMQHRGQEGAGIVVSDGQKVRSRRELGLVSDVFPAATVENLPGRIGIGHVRYSTTGAERVQNVQPLVAECADGIWAIGHNGNLVNARSLKRLYEESGAIFQTSTDSEVLVHLLADPFYRRNPRRIERALDRLVGAFSFVIMNRDSLIAARDRRGFRPLVLGRLGEGWVFASETCALTQAGAEYVREIEPGEVVTVNADGLRSTFFADPQCTQLAQCVFEIVYFSRPDSIVFGNRVHMVRLQYGMRLAEEHPVDADIVVPVPDSGTSAALGYSRGSGIPMDFGFIRNHYVGRTFIMPRQVARAEGVDMKLSVIPDVVKGKRVVVVDDSIVRGTTARRRVWRLREAGAKEVHVRISCPPVANPCFFGIDFPSKSELVAGVHDVDTVRRFIGADTLGYLSIEGLLSPFQNKDDFCLACFNGEYKESIEDAGDKLSLEAEHLELDLGLGKKEARR